MELALTISLLLNVGECVLLYLFFNKALKANEELVKHTLLAAKASNADELSKATQDLYASKLNQVAIKEELEKYNRAEAAAKTPQGFFPADTTITDIDGKQYQLKDLDIQW